MRRTFILTIDSEQSVPVEVAMSLTFDPAGAGSLKVTNKAPAEVAVALGTTCSPDDATHYIIREQGADTWFLEPREGPHPGLSVEARRARIHVARCLACGRRLT